MRTAQLGNSGISCSVLGFGCSTLMGSSGKRESLRALAGAWDAGITLYDTARSYGGGESEALLGEFFAGRRQQAVISTKFGIVPVRPPLWKRLAKPAARKVIALLPSVRSKVGKEAAKHYVETPFTVGLLEESIHISLRKLKTDYVDLLFFHGPPASVLDQEDLLAAVEKLVDSGKVRAAGISAGAGLIGPTLDRRPRSLSVFQFPCNLFNFSAPKLIESRGQSDSNIRNFGTIANQPFGGTANVRRNRDELARIATTSGIDPLLREKLETLDDSVLSDVVLNVILSHRSINTVVCSMVQASHLVKNVGAIQNSRFTQAEIRAIRDLIIPISNSQSRTGVAHSRA